MFSILLLPFMIAASKYCPAVAPNMNAWGTGTKPTTCPEGKEYGSGFCKKICPSGYRTGPLLCWKGWETIARNPTAAGCPPDLVLRRGQCHYPCNNPDSVS